MISKLLLIMFIIFIPFQNCGLQNTALGYFGMYLSNVPLIVLLLINIFLKKNIEIKTFTLWGKIYVYIFLYSFIILVFFIMNHNGAENMSQYMYKLTSNMIILFFWMFAYYCIYNTNIKLDNYIFIAYIITLISFLLGDVFSINIGSFLQNNAIEYSRFRGFTLEASFFINTIVILGMLSINFAKTNIVRVLLFVSVVFFLICGGSKGALIVFLLSILMFILFVKNIGLFKKILLCVLCIIFMYIAWINILSVAIMSDIDYNTSVATRLSAVISTIFLILKYPLGTGFATFLPMYGEVLFKAYDFFNSMFSINLNDAELIQLLMYSSGKGLVIKPIIFQYIAYFGLPFIFLLYKWIKYISNNIKNINSILAILFVYIIISNATYANFNYDSIIALAIIGKEISKKVKLDNK